MGIWFSRGARSEWRAIDEMKWNEEREPPRRERIDIIIIFIIIMKRRRRRDEDQRFCYLRSEELWGGWAGWGKLIVWDFLEWISGIFGEEGNFCMKIDYGISKDENKWWEFWAWKYKWRDFWHRNKCWEFWEWK